MPVRVRFANSERLIRRPDPAENVTGPVGSAGLYKPCIPTRSLYIQGRWAAQLGLDAGRELHYATDKTECVALPPAARVEASGYVYGTEQMSMTSHKQKRLSGLGRRFS